MTLAGLKVVVVDLADFLVLLEHLWRLGDVFDDFEMVVVESLLELMELVGADSGCSCKSHEVAEAACESVGFAEERVEHCPG